LEAEVVSAREDALTLRTGEGGTLSARSRTPLTVLPGDTLRLLVTGRQGSVLTVALADDRAAAPRDLLRRLNLPVTPQNLRLAAALVSSRIETSARTWEALEKALAAFPGMTPDEAVFMLEHQVPVNRQNVLLFHRMSQQEFQLGSLLTQLEQVIADDAAVPGQTPALRGTAAAPAANPASPESVAPRPTAATSAETVRPEAGSPTPTGDTRPVGPTAAQTSAIPTQGPAETAAPSARAIPLPVDGGPPTNSPALPQTAPPADIAPRPPEQAIPGPNTPPRPDPAPPLPAPSATPPNSPAPTGNTPPPKAEEPPAAPGQPPKPQAEQPLDRAETLPALRDMVKSLFRQVRAERGQALPGALDAVKLAKETSDALRAIGERLHELPPQRREAALTLMRDIADGIQFARQMEHFSTVVQFPVQINGRDADAELYVFRDGARGNKLDPRNATLFLSLATAHMGRVETLTRVIGVNVECDFKLAEKAWADQAQADAGLLRELLAQNGFQLTRSSFEKAEAPAEGPLAVSQEWEKFAKRYTFEAQI
jgi:hypothetical protein